MVGAVTEQTNPRWMSWSSNATGISNNPYSMVQLAYSSILQSNASHHSLSAKPESTQLLTYEMLMLTVLTTLALVLALCVFVVIALSLPSEGEGEGFDESAATKFAGIVPFTGADLEHLLSSVPTDGQDLPPWSSGKWLRIEARIEGPVEGGGNICGPLTGSPCVAYKARVSEHSHSGKQALVADAQRSINFEVSFLDAPSVRVRVAGGCVRMVDIKEGSYASTMSFSDAPEHCQTFALQNALSGAAPWHCGHHLLEFQERALIIGTCVTLVGELRRDARGALTLTALSDNTPVQRRRAPDVERWRTSWECSGLASPDSMNHSSHACSVLVSDNPRLLNGLVCDAGHVLMLKASGYALAVP
jgi:hypothetical protein